MIALTIEPYMPPASLYSQFLKEVHGLNCLEYSWGYATYELGPDYVYIIDIFVVPTERSAQKGIQLMNEIGAVAQQLGICKMYGSIAAKSNEPIKNYEMLRHLGFEDSHKDEQTYYLVRELK